MTATKPTAAATPPTVIYLQVGEDVDPADPDIDWSCADITWCRDRIYDTDLEYRLVQRTGKSRRARRRRERR